MIRLSTHLARVTDRSVYIDADDGTESGVTVRISHEDVLRIADAVAQKISRNAA
ncbi:MAG: hypothetical protein AAGA90_20475 [Actinomycetota bacterium]